MVCDVVMMGGEGVWGRSSWVWRGRRGGFRDSYSIPIQFQVDSFYYTVLLISSSFFPFRCQSHIPVHLSLVFFSNEWVTGAVWTISNCFPQYRVKQWCLLLERFCFFRRFTLDSSGYWRRNRSNQPLLTASICPQRKTYWNQHVQRWNHSHNTYLPFQAESFVLSLWLIVRTVKLMIFASDSSVIVPCMMYSPLSCHCQNRIGITIPLIWTQISCMKSILFWVVVILGRCTLASLVTTFIFVICRLYGMVLG